MGFWPANTVDDDTIEIYTDESRSEVLLKWAPLRMQTERPVIPDENGVEVRRPNRSLADYIAPKGTKPDWIGLFAVTAGLGEEAHGGKPVLQETAAQVVLEGIEPGGPQWFRRARCRHRPRYP